MNGSAEARYIARIGKLLDAMPKDAQLRTLAFLTSRALGVGSWDGAEVLYKHASIAREDERTHLASVEKETP